jgi:hypothetical protein
VSVAPVAIAPNSWEIEQRCDGALLVRVHSSNRNGRRLPDAVFTFRCGDPQYQYWQEQFENRGDSQVKS